METTVSKTVQQNKGRLKGFDKNKNIESSKNRIRSLIKKCDKVYLLETTKTGVGSLTNLYTVVYDWDGTMICENFEGAVMSSENCITLRSDHDKAFFFLTE